MKKILYLFMVVTCFACTTSTNVESESEDQNFSGNLKDRLDLNLNNDRIRFDSITKEEYDKYNKTDYKNPLDTTKKIEAVQGVLRIPLDNGKYVAFKDTLANTESSDVRINENLGILTDMNYYVVMVSYYESAEFYLVDKKNGRKFKLISEPFVSPSKRFIAANSTALETDILSNQFQLWETNSKGMSSLIDIRDQSWFIIEMKWIADNKLVLKFGSSEGAGEKYGALTIN